MYLAGHGPGDDGAAGFHARLAQSVEHAAVNRSVVGSSPTTSAMISDKIAVTNKKGEIYPISSFFIAILCIIQYVFSIFNHFYTWTKWLHFIAVILSFYRTRKTRTNDLAFFLATFLSFSQNIEKTIQAHKA